MFQDVKDVSVIHVDEHISIQIKNKSAFIAFVFYAIYKYMAIIHRQ